MSNSTGTPLWGEELLYTQLELITLTTIAGTLYGIAFTLFCLYVHALAPRLRNEDTKRQAKLMLVSSIAIMFCGLYYLMSNAWITQDAYIKGNSYIESPFSYELPRHTAPVVYVGLACQVTVDALTLAIEVWRVWVIWSRTEYAHFVVILPILCFLTFTGLKLRGVVLEITLPPAKLHQLDYKLNIVAHAVQGTTTILCTLLISGYLIFKHRLHRKLITPSQGFKGYTNIVVIMIESYALESIWLLTEGIIMDKPGGNFFCESLTYIEIIAYLLVQYRVARGSTFEPQSEDGHLSCLRWKRSNQASMELAETSETQCCPHECGISKLPDTPSVSHMA